MIQLEIRDPLCEADRAYVVDAWGQISEQLADMDLNARVRPSEELAANLAKMHIVRVALRGGAYVGAIWGTIEAAGYRKTPFAYVWYLFVQEDQREMGVGRQLVIRFEDSAKMQDVQRVELSTHVLNTKAQKFWEALGYPVFREVRAKQL